MNDSMSSCPKCRAALPDEMAIECPSCGVVLAKAHQSALRPSTVAMMQPGEQSRIRRTSAALAVGVPIIGMFAGFTLLFGLFATGGGHGTYVPWYLGLVLSGLAWLVCLSALILEFVAWKRGEGLAWWFSILLLLFVVATLIGFWGSSG